jgi:hypothetical protein
MYIGAMIRMNPASERLCLHQALAKDVIGRNMEALPAEGVIDRGAAMDVLHLPLIEYRIGRSPDDLYSKLNESPDGDRGAPADAV